MTTVSAARRHAQAAYSRPTAVSTDVEDAGSSLCGPTFTAPVARVKVQPSAAFDALR
ncbi:hypothetical protein [Amycolatopsis balhimycina]|uniref:hypothetical protein n=1 Tax=Amycolatopsis balhimycina TaxID=208443 RepID=UPI00039F7594|nr:hypothetical protein [Amycolatopsis balhimycina]